MENNYHLSNKKAIFYNMKVYYEAIGKDYFNLRRVNSLLHLNYIIYKSRLSLNFSCLTHLISFKISIIKTWNIIKHANPKWLSENFIDKLFRNIRNSTTLITSNHINT